MEFLSLRRWACLSFCKDCFIFVLTLGKQGWRRGESTRLQPISLRSSPWAGATICRLSYYLVAGCLPCSEGFLNIAGRNFWEKLPCGVRGGGGGGGDYISPIPVVSSQFLSTFLTIVSKNIPKKERSYKISGIPENEMILFLILGILQNSWELEHF